MVIFLITILSMSIKTWKNSTFYWLMCVYQKHYRLDTENYLSTTCVDAGIYIWNFDALFFFPAPNIWDSSPPFAYNIRNDRL